MRTGIDLDLPPEEAFDLLVVELGDALARQGMRLEPGPHGRVVEGQTEVGRVVTWEPGERILLEWRPADWEPDATTEVELRLEPAGELTRVTLEHRGLERLVGDTGGAAVGWFAGEVVAPLLRAASPTSFGDWVTDRRARRPSGPEARETYRDPLYHRPNFRAILRALEPAADDYLLEVGCGGGALLEEALRSGCRAAAVDHSPAMVRLAREVNREAIGEGRLEVVEADAERLPFPDATFTCAVMTGVFGFLPDPVGALAEIRRVLGSGGRLAVFTGSRELRGTPAAPEPMARRISFYEDDELERLAREAGFAEARVERPDLQQHARASGVPAEALPFFSGRAGQLLLARKA